MVDFFSEQFANSMIDEAQGRVSANRFRHIKSVAKTATWLAQVYGEDPRKANLAGILHDWDKGLSCREQIAKACEFGLDQVFGLEVLSQAPHILHGPTAAYELAHRFEGMPKDVLDAIFYHTIARIEMTKLDMIIYVADAIEPTRNYPEIDELTAMVGTSSLFEVYAQVFRFWTARLIEKGRFVYPKTIEIHNSIVKKLDNEKN